MYMLCVEALTEIKYKYFKSINILSSQSVTLIKTNANEDRR